MLRSSAVAVPLLMASPAWGHGAANFGDFYAGLAQPIFHPESLLLLLAVGLWAGQTPGQPRLEVVFAFAAAVLAGALAGALDLGVPGTLALVRSGALVVGALVALRWSPPIRAMLLVAALFGLAQGHFAAYAERVEVSRPVVFALGLGLGPVLVASWFVALTERFRAEWVQVGLRVGGSWIATIGLLVSVLAVSRTAA